MVREIRIRKLKAEEARRKLEAELESAFLRGERHVRIIHGIGTFKLRQLTATVVEEMGLGRVLPDSLGRNPGVTEVELDPPPETVLRWHLRPAKS
ncbi:MAG: Smr/MutS family protein [Spirochaetales bacterium]|nr:Smr/MutS family protein [Spirochaetales bacterium]